jgi:two-component system chemotaxis response regulator CheY
MKKILCVDDSDTILTQLKSLFEPSGFQVVQAYDGFSGLEMLRCNPDVNLIICDVNMPELDGLSMCEKIKEEKLAQGVPIVMLTTETNVELKSRGRAAGVLGWINKPYSSEKLLVAVTKLLTTSAAQKAA